MDGELYQLPINNGPNHLHGGMKGFSRRLWKTKEIGPDFVTFEYFSEDGEEGYPSAVRANVTYRLPADSSQLITEFNAVNEGNKTTPINMTNHTYFNLHGIREAVTSIRDHRLAVFSDEYLPADDNGLVTGDVRSVDNTPYDLRNGGILGDGLDQLLPKPGYDAHFCNVVTPTPKPLAELHCPTTGVKMKVLGTQPGLQIYTAQYMDETGGKFSKSYGKYSGIAMETQHYPDSVNHPRFPPIWILPGEKYHQMAVYEWKLE